jgi:hypothetical protein
MKKRIVYIRLLLFTFFILVSFVAMGREPKITYEKFYYNSKFTCIMLGDENIIWDTGSNHTLFFCDATACKIPVIPTIAVDGYGKRAITFLYFSRSLRVAAITMKNVFYNTIKQNKIPSSIRQSGISGIFGMNVINRANWIIDFVEGSIQTVPRKDTVLSGQEHRFCLLYSKKRYPKTTIYIQGVEIKNVLIDSGSSADLMLLESDIRKINQKIQPIDSIVYHSPSPGVFVDDTIQQKLYRYKNIVINDSRFNKLKIIQHSSERSIGIGFFRKFDKVFLNTKEKIFLFY